MSKLNAKQRQALSDSQFAIQSKAPASGSYPINDMNHAKNALARSSGKPLAGKVRAAVKRKFPSIGMKGAINRRGLDNAGTKSV